MKIISCITLSSLVLMGSSFAANLSQQEINKKNVRAFYNEIINRKDFNAAEKYMGAGYVQHNPLAADGKEGLKNYVAYLRGKYPLAKSEIKRIFAEGDYVILHVHTILQPQSKGLAVVDIFKLIAVS